MRTSVKSIMVLFISLVIIGALPSIVCAATTEEELLQNIEDVLPEKITLNIPEVEFKNASELLATEVKEILKENNIDITGISFDVNVNPIYLLVHEISSFYTGSIDLVYGDTSRSIEIEIEYNNHSNYNSADEQYVKNLKLDDPEYITCDIESSLDDLYTIIADVYEKQVNDKSIEIFMDSGASDGNGLDFVFHGDSAFAAIFKNDVLYDARKVHVKVVSEMTIPSDIEDTEKAYANYVLPVIEEKTGYSNLTLTKGAKLGNVEVENGYTVETKDGFYIGKIVLNKEEVKNIKKEDTSTGVKLESTSAVLPSNVVLSVEKVTEQNTLNIVEKSLKDISNKYVVYDITLLQDNTKIQPKRKS